MKRKELLHGIEKNNERILELQGYNQDYEKFMKKGFDREHIMPEYLCDLAEIDTLQEDNKIRNAMLQSLPRV